MEALVTSVGPRVELNDDPGKSEAHSVSPPIGRLGCGDLIGRSGGTWTDVEQQQHIGVGKLISDNQT